MPLRLPGVTLVVLATLVSTSAADVPVRDAAVARATERLLRGPLRDGTTSVYVVDAATGERVLAIDPDDRLNPASNVKLVATATALDLLGPDFRYPTRVLGETLDPSGHVAEDVYLLGSHDPTLTSAGIADLAHELVEAGVRRVDGDIVVGEVPSRDGLGRARVTLTIRGTEPGAAPVVEVSPPSDYVEIVVEARTVARRARRRLAVTSEPVIDDRGQRRLRITVTGEVVDGRRAVRRVAVRERQLLAAHLLRRALRDAGVEVTGGVHVTAFRDYLDAAAARGFVPVPLAEHRSRRLSRIIQRINKDSTNWLADRVVMTAAARRAGGPPTMEKAVDAMYAFLEKRAGLGRDDLLIDTGSGLSYRTEMSARQVVKVLRAALGLGVAFRESLAVGGHDGTIRRRFGDLDGVVLGKTGTLDRVVALSGLLEVEDRQLLFSIITNGHRPSRQGRVRRAHEQLVEVLCRYLHAQLTTP